MSESQSPPADGPQSARAKRALLANMRHELRTPINAIIGYSEMLLEDARDAGEDDFAADLDKIHNSGLRLLSQVNEILDPSKIEADNEELDVEKFGVNIRLELRTPLNHILGYCEMLLEDARDAEREAIVSDLERIHLSGNRLLAMIDDIVSFSHGEAAGSEPRVDDADVSTMIQDVVTSIRSLDSQECQADDERGHVLVVDDNEINRDMISRRLERQGHTVQTAENGRQALEMLANQQFDVVLLDIMMPEMNGFQALERLKADESLRHLPVIMISALDELDSVVRCIEMGAEDFLPKPFNPVLLRARIGACLEKKRLRDREVMYLKQIEEEKSRSDRLLHVILPDKIVEELKATNAVMPRRYENVAVLFTDIVGFTPYCEKREPEEIVSNLQALIETYEELAVRHDLEKIKTIGDSFMAVSGLLLPVENPVLNCIQCGLEMVAAAKRVPAMWNVRVGIHAGTVVAGVLGRRQYMFDLWGDTVNTAARMESHGVAGGVTLSGSAWNAVEQWCIGESRGSIEIKGKGGMQVVLFKEFRDCVIPQPAPFTATAL